MRNKGMQLEEIHIDQKKKAIALEQLRQAVKEKEISYSPSVASVVLGQMKYLSLSALGGQLIDGSWRLNSSTLTINSSWLVRKLNSSCPGRCNAGQMKRLLDDREMIREIHRGKKEYLNTIVEKYYDDIYRFCCHWAISKITIMSIDITSRKYKRLYPKQKYFIIEEELGSLYLSFDTSGGSEFTDSSLKIGYVDIRQQ